MAGLPYKGGLTPVQGGGASGWNSRMEVGRASVGEAIYSGDPVYQKATNGRLVTGNVQSSKTSAGDAAYTQFVGVAAGFFYIDTNGQPREARSIANVSSRNGEYDGEVFSATDPGAAVRYLADPEQIYAVKANSSVARAAVAGVGFNLVSAGTGSNYAGRSGAKLAVATATASADNGQFTVIRPLRAEEYVSRASAGGTAVDNNWDSPETVVLVKSRFHRDRGLPIGTVNN